MKLIWHLVRKDLHRLRWPVTVLSLLTVAKTVFYAAVAGLLGAPSVGWVNRLQNGPEALLCGIMEPLIAYFLVGWLVFEDSPVGKDAHWITRPISGWQLFLAKTAGAGLMFVLLPLALTIPWWLAGGFEPSEIALAAVELTVLRSVLVAMGLACASLTDGFPRFTLWSLVGFGVFAMGQVIFDSERPEIGFSRVVVWCVGGGLGAVMLAGHQFVTRRQRKSFALAAIGIVLVVGLGGFWRWDLAPVAPASPDHSRVRLEMVRPAHYHVFLRQHYARLTLKTSGAPGATAAANITGTGEWSFKGAKAWTSYGHLSNGPQTHDVIRHLLGFPPTADHGQIDIPFSFSPVLVRRTASEPATFHGTFRLQMFRGRVAAEMPLRNGSAFGRAYTISELASGPLTDRLPVAGAGVDSGPLQNAVSFILTERVIGGLAAAYFARRESSGGPAPGPAGSGIVPLLVRRGTDEFFTCDWTRSDQVATATLNQAGVVGLKLVFPISGPIRLEEFTFVAVRFTSDGTIRREVVVDPLPFAEIPNGAGDGATKDTDRMDVVAKDQAAGDKFMGSVLVARHDVVVFERSYGWANLEWKVPHTTGSKFRIGSVTKQFTAAATLLLEERGRLKLDDPVTKYIPDAPEAWKQVTLFHLLTHTSGVPSFTDLPEYLTLKLSPEGPAQTIARIRDKPLDFTPGEKFKYSNSGYVLLGWIVELVSGQDYGAFVQENIFKPLGMNDSGCDSNTALIPRRASGYVPGPDGLLNAPYIDMHVPHGAGALYSTTGDLHRWTQGLFGGKLLSPASLAKMTTPYKENYAFGLDVSTVNGRKVISHNGGIEGFNSDLAYYPESKVTIVVLANVNGPAYVELPRKLAAVTFGESLVLPAERKEIEVTAATLQRYVGVYQVGPKFRNTVRLSDRRLTTQLSGQAPLPLFPESESRFFLKVVDAQVEFFTDEQGKVTHLIQFQNGRDQKAPRISDTVVERKAVALPTKTLESYAGAYELRPGFDIVITREGEQLLTQAAGQPTRPLFAESETCFFFKEIDTQVEFFKDTTGAVTHLIIHKGDQDFKAQRKP